MKKNALLIVCLFCIGGLFAAGSAAGMSKHQLAAMNFGDVSRSNVGNDFVKVYCSDYTGMFTIGTADERSLLFGYPSEGSTSHTVFNVDGALYSNGGIDGPAMVTPTSSVIVDNSIVSTFTINGVAIIQRLTPEAGDQYGAIRISYEATAVDGGTHQVGILVELDTMINDNDAAPLSTSSGLVTVETEFTTTNMPLFWQAFEAGDYDPAYLVAEGLLQGSDARTPDIFWLGDWSSLYGVKWDYTPSGEPYGDSAVIYRWNPIAVGTTTQVFTTYYGTGVATSQDGDLALVVGAPSSLLDIDGYLMPDPFGINLIAVNTSTQTASNLSATITLPNGLHLLSGNATQTMTPSTIAPSGTATAYWAVLADNPASDVTLTYTINVNADGVDDNTISVDIFVPHTEYGVSNDDQTIEKRDIALTNYPNPFNPNTTIAFNLPESGMTRVAIANVRGQIVRELVNTELPAGPQQVTWNGNDDNGNAVASGVYLVLTTHGDNGRYTAIKKMILLK